MARTIGRLPKSSTNIRRKKFRAASLVEQDDKLIITAPYNPNFIAAIKETIPKENREWEPKSKTWIISRSKKALVEELLSKYYSSIERE